MTVHSTEIDPTREKVQQCAARYGASFEGADVRRDRTNVSKDARSDYG